MLLIKGVYPDVYDLIGKGFSVNDAHSHYVLEREALVVRMRHEHHLSFAEMARAMKLSKGRPKQIYEKAMRRRANLHKYPNAITSPVARYFNGGLSPHLEEFNRQVSTPVPQVIESLSIPVHWKVHTPNLLVETLTNPGTAALAIPFNILGKLLAAVAERAIELDDPELNRLMMRLTLYEQADPQSSAYDKNLSREMTT